MGGLSTRSGWFSSTLRIECIWHNISTKIAVMSPMMQQAMTSLHQTGRVSLPGAPAFWSKVIGVLFKILLGLIGFLVIGALVIVLVMVVNGALPGSAALFGTFGAVVLLGGLGALVRSWHRKQNAYRDIEHQPVIMDPRGLTFRGIGPVPWTDFGIAEHRMVPAERDSGWTRRAVMELTQKGLFNVNERTPRALRKRISPPMGPVWNRHHRYIYVPGVDGLKQREVMELINRARYVLGR